jgi:uracil phosphoribosyltransferase
MKFPGSFKVRVTIPGQEPYCATSLLHKATPEKTIAFLHVVAARKGIDATYEAISDDEYWAYRNRNKVAA